MNPLYKFCERKFNPVLGCDALKIGTLDYYRNLDPDFSISDSLEGISSGKTKGTPIKFTPEEMRNSRMKVPLFDIGPNSNVTVSIGKGVTVRTPNLFIFSCSLSKINQSLIEYKSSYKIKNAANFAKVISQLLLQQLTTGLSLNGHSLSYSDYGSVSIYSYHNLINYCQKPFEFTDENKMDVFEKINDFQFNLFNKSLEYANDREYRFVFIPTLYGQLLSSNKDFEIISLNQNIKTLLFELNDNDLK